MQSKKTLVCLALAAALTTAVPLASAHFVKDEPRQSFRQSWFTLLAGNFGPIAAMVKGEAPWDIEVLRERAADLSSLSRVELLRAFTPGSEKGTTRAKPEIWDNQADFESKLEDLQLEIAELEAVAEEGDREAIAQQVKRTGEACKACHDDYKAENYLY